MAIIPEEKVDFKVVRRSDFPITLTFKDSTSSAINLSGHTITATVWDEARTNKYADWAVTVTNASAGTANIKLTDTQTATFDKDFLKYDVKLTEPNGDEFTYIRGTLYILEGYTP